MNRSSITADRPSPRCITQVEHTNLTAWLTQPGRTTCLRQAWSKLVVWIWFCLTNIKYNLSLTMSESNIKYDLTLTMRESNVKYARSIPYFDRANIFISTPAILPPSLRAEARQKSCHDLFFLVSGADRH